MQTAIRGGAYGILVSTRGGAIFVTKGLWQTETLVEGFFKNRKPSDIR